ncbi:MAG: mechanosensitive ion channel family protein [Lachnospiraceae bacterium]|nr:mechanosensitive ion channel family protein [Lachnospiraceae bacterium]MBP5415829.1 mechanosensitive ion channel family protein [Lachnospiraceae bacterium]MBP5744866.1 mechanosensitive ion channel family protein [Lachnospiraceae bacterium]
MQTVEDISNNIKSGALQTYLNELPDKLIAMGVKVLLTFIIIIVGIKLINMLRKTVRKALEKINVEKGVVQFTDSLIKAVLTILLVLWAAVNFGVEATSIAALISSVSIAIGLALQGSLSNFAGGILILLLKPFKVGDYIKEDTHSNEGTVKEISLFYTKLLSYDNKTIVLPNGILANSSMVNFSDEGKRRLDLRVSISYKADIKKAKDVIMDVIDKSDLVLSDLQKIVFVAELDNSGVILGIRCFADADQFFKTRWSLLEDIKYALDENDIEIPYPQLDVHLDK